MMNWGLEINLRRCFISITPRERQKTKHLFSQRHYINLVIFFYLATLQYPIKWYEGIYEAFTNILSRLQNTFETLLKSVGPSSFYCLNASWSSGDKWAKGRECLANHNLSSHTEVYSEPFWISLYNAQKHYKYSFCYQNLMLPSCWHLSVETRITQTQQLFGWKS